MSFPELLAFTLVVFLPLKENPYIIPHLKALISGWKFRGGQKCGSTLSLWNALVKTSILLHKMANECKHSHAIVNTWIVQLLFTPICALLEVPVLCTTTPKRGLPPGDAPVVEHKNTATTFSFSGKFFAQAQFVQCCLNTVGSFF